MRPHLPGGLAEEFRGLRAKLRARPSADFLAWASTVARLLSWCRRALAQAHLVAVASTLHRSLRLDIEDLRALRIPVDVLEQFPSWRAGTRAGFRPTSFGLRLAAEGADQPVRALRLHLSPKSGTVPLVMMLLRDLLRRLDADVRFLVLVEPGADGAAIRALAREFGGGGPRVRFAHVRFPTVFARDNGIAARDAHGDAVLFIPRGFRTPSGTLDDALDPAGGRGAAGLRGVRSRLFWQGGNIVHDADRCLIGADTIAENMARLGLAADEVVRTFAAELGMDVVVLGDPSRTVFDETEGTVTASAQASYHLDLDIALLGPCGPRRDPTAIIADPQRGLRFLPEVLNRRRMSIPHYAPPDRARRLIAAGYRASAWARRSALREYRERLVDLGYRVVGVPDLRTNLKENLLGTTNLHFTYCNVLPGRWRGREAVHFLPWGIRGLDRDAEGCFRAAGVAPVRASSVSYLAHAMMDRAAGLRCFCGPVP